MDDDALMEGIARGDEAALRLLLDRWQRPVQVFLARCLGDEEEARDLAQETFLRVHGQAGRYQAQGRFRSWLFRIAGNLCRSRLRRRRLVRWLPLGENLQARRAAAPQSQRPDVASESSLLQEAVDRVLDQLPERQRLAFVLKRFEDLSYKEIAEILQTSPSAVESLLVRATRRLQEELARQGWTP